MDIASHGFIGAMIAETAPRPRPRQALWGALFAMAPDLACMCIAYPFVGWKHGRAFFIPEHADWAGIRAAHPWIAATWEAPHSLWFLLLVVVPLVFYLDLPRLCIAAYVSHQLVDIAAHTGEWSATPLWPLAWRVEGWADPWAWPAWGWAVSSGLCCAGWLVMRRFQRWRRSGPEQL